MAMKRKAAKKKKVAKKKAGKRKKAAKKRRTARGMWSAEHIKLIKSLFPNNPTAVIAKQLGRKVDAVKKKASRMGLRKSKKYLKTLGRS